ncbi:MAG TPA: hypothetical protein DCQ30_04075 [Acidimicrobiaceae bacterium]|nr:hypothetical protein [Acidimicrobiaceae bacterium]
MKASSTSASAVGLCRKAVPGSLSRQGSSRISTGPEYETRSEMNGSRTSNRMPPASKASLLVVSARRNMKATGPSGRYRQAVISAVPSLARLPSRKNPDTDCPGSTKLKYMDSLKLGSGPNSCMYSSFGSRRTPMGAHARQGRRPGATGRRELRGGCPESRPGVHHLDLAPCPWKV